MSQAFNTEIWSITSLEELSLQLNADNRKFVRSSQFTSGLTDRFYENNSLQAQQRIIQQDLSYRKRSDAIKQAVEKETWRLNELQALLSEEIERTKQRLEEYRNSVRHSSTKIQSNYRIHLAVKQLNSLMAEKFAKLVVTNFAQKRYRGINGRHIAAECRKQFEIRREKESLSSVTIQKNVRKKLSMQILASLKQDAYQRLCNISSITIQSMSRIWSARKLLKVMRDNFIVLKNRRYSAALKIQCILRMNLAGSLVEQRREELEIKKLEAQRSDLIRARFRKGIIVAHAIIKPLPAFTPCTNSRSASFAASLIVDRTMRQSIAPDVNRDDTMTEASSKRMSTGRNLGTPFSRASQTSRYSRPSVRRTMLTPSQWEKYSNDIDVEEARQKAASRASKARELLKLQKSEESKKSRAVAESLKRLEEERRQWRNKHESPISKTSDTPQYESFELNTKQEKSGTSQEPSNPPRMPFFPDDNATSIKKDDSISGRPDHTSECANISTD